MRTILLEEVRTFIGFVLSVVGGMYFENQDTSGTGVILLLLAILVHWARWTPRL